MNLNRSLAKRFDTQIEGLKLQCLAKTVREDFLAEAELEAEKAGFQFIDDLTEKMVIKRFGKLRTLKASVSRGVQGGTPSVAKAL